MSHTYVNCLIHVVFSTREREPLIEESWSAHLHAMMGGIARDRGFPALMIGGIEDHVHALISLPADLSLAKAMQVLKSSSSKWVTEHIRPSRPFAWQTGYGAFSVGITNRDATIAYIRNQRDHHHTRDFQDEFRDFLTRHGVVWDERYIWG